MRAIDVSGFERKFQENIDPWKYASSRFEARKREVLLRACGLRMHGRGFEAGCAIGENTRWLARRCLRLLAVDASPTALREAQRRLKNYKNVALARAVLPARTPRGPFDLIVASELAYYLSPNALRELVHRLTGALAPGGRMVFLHHVVPFVDAAQLPEQAQKYVRRRLSRTMRLVFDECHGRYEALAFQKRRRPRPVP